MKKKMNIIGYFTTPIKVVEGEMSCMQDISSYALDVKDLLNEKVSPELSDKLNEMLLGFNEDVQLEMVENMLSFICANVLQVPASLLQQQPCFLTQATLTVRTR